MAATPSIGRLDAVHPVRSELGICVAPLRPTGGCMDRSSSMDLLRTDFHVVLLCTGGSGDHVVDLTVHHHEPGSLLWIRPGQVHERPPDVEGTAVCFTDDFLGPDAALRVGPTSWQLADDDLGDVRAHLAVLTGEYERYVFGPTGSHLSHGDTMLRHLLAAFLLRIGQAPALFAGAPVAPHPVATAFFDLLERCFATTHTVEEYAAALGYSSRTLARASVEASGLTPKQVIDARLALEARRMLVYTDLSVAAVGRRLGFDDPANFCKFFARATGTTPGAFREQRRGRAARSA
ncbi:transcriptional regulator [Actinomycetota bacterium]|nr:transcriptional regulator [Actinomycetota bacterium]